MIDLWLNEVDRRIKVEPWFGVIEITILVFDRKSWSKWEE
jgi:hypothetical protein